MKKQTGYSQIEVLVSVLVLAIGFLGMAGLQATSLQNSQKSVFRTQAAYLSYEILERMRANKGGDYITGANGFPTFTDCVSTAATTANCSAEQMKNFDLAQCKCSLGSSNAACTNVLSNSLYSTDSVLPNGTGKIVYSAATDRFTITVSWDESRNGTAKVETFELTTSL